MERKEYKGKLDATDKKFALVVSRFNEFLSKELLNGAIDCLERHNAKAVEIFWTPGSFEIPTVAKTLAESKRFNAIIALGAIIRGDTPHFEYIASVVSKAIAKIGYSMGVPITFGIITADTIEQAIERAGTKAGNKGWTAALFAIEMANLMTEIGG
ncbi:MAG: 6,7-dimethyl-8-ribityllumazine synthase [candidate division WOR-3 bacterium]|nr:6,7-dimethyl-8-ribityllumazine synthase [candidate division WOR-3 bacterium]MDH5683505.1 6,7-dimethyl-8-ribityllumazine synthase [candidate division WOR-3 bacterium]